MSGTGSRSSGALTVHTDCRHFIGDRPCVPHKRENVRCAECRHYERVRTRILIIKLGALGDVLRTTCILDGLHAAHPGAAVEWMTMDDAVCLFEGNPLVRRLHVYPGDGLLSVLNDEFDLVINLDNSPVSGRLASLVRAKAKRGYGCDPAGAVFPFDAAAREWYEMALFDDVKRRNTKTYQQIALEICGLPSGRFRPHLYLSARERGFAADRAREWGLDPARPVIGLNTGASARWPHKEWTENGFVALIEMLRRPPDGLPVPQVLLLGGPKERERNARIMRRTGTGVRDTGSAHSLREFCAIVDLCDLLVTGDTLAVHIATALGKRLVVLFGPTSVSEIDLYGCGAKLASDAPCVGGYRTDCKVTPTCMERIPAAAVRDAVVEQLSSTVGMV
jgi:ADP-heptose:LPS heptosyltransferase